MSSTTKCRHCGQPLPEMRVGIRLSLKKARIFDAIRRAGENRITTKQLLSDYDFAKNKNTLLAHIWQINEKLEETNYRLRGKTGYGYRLERVSFD